MIMIGSITIRAIIVSNQRSTHDWGFIHMHGQYLQIPHGRRDFSRPLGGVRPFQTGSRADPDRFGWHLGYHADSPPDRRAIALAKSRGIDISGQRARKVSAQDFKRFDYLLAMDRDNLHILQDMAPEGLSHRASLILSFAPDVALDEVPDPYYGGEQGFLRCYQLIDEAAAGFLDHLIAHHFPKHL